jgi:dihydrolipoamide dehydrogenase
MTNTKRVDVAILGAGTAGMAAYRAVKKEGGSALLIEAAKYGTTCARVGCMPSKLLIAAADAAYKARHADPFGVHATVSVAGREVMARVRGERDRFVGFVLDSVQAFPEADRLMGTARFVSPTEVDVGGTRVEAKAFVIATGSSPWLPPLFEAIEDRVVVNDHVFDWTDLPKSAAVFGAGVIGLELGQALTRLGVKVRLFGKSGTVGPLRDPAVKAAARKALEAELDIDFEAKVESVKPEGTGTAATVRFTDRDGNARSETYEVVLVAAGRRPNVKGLGLDELGIDGAIDRYTLRWGHSHVFRAGDVNDDMPLLHEAADEGTIAGHNAALHAAGKPVERGHRRTPLGVVFSDPNLAVVGGGYEAAKAQGEFATGFVDFTDQGRSRVMRENHGAAALYANPKTHEFLGAELAAPRGEHLGHLLAWAHQAGLTIEQMLAMPFYHPVVEEGLRTALRDLAAKLPPIGADRSAVTS